MKPRHLLMSGGVVMAAALAWFGNRGAESDMAEPVVHDAARPPGPASGQAVAPSRAAVLPPELPILVLLDRAMAIAQGRAGLPAQAPQSIFGGQSWAPAAAAAAPLASAPVPTPVAPALPFSYIGKQSRGGQVEVFLAQGDQVHVVRLHSLLDNTYRVDAISPTAISFTYLPLNMTQQLSIGASD